MGFCFIHTSDWQIGKPFRNFDDRVAGRLEAARLDTIDRIGAIAREQGARHVLVAGDIYDAQTVPLVTLKQPMHRMQQVNDVTWWLLPGNHDPARAQGVWQRLRAEGLPENVRIVDEPIAVEMEPGVFVFPAPLVARSVADDPTGWMHAEQTPEGALRIGLAHGSIKGFGSADESAVGIDPERARKSGLDYLALGDWHGCAKINPRTWYSGTPEPDRYPENEPGFCLAVEIAAAGEVPVVERIACAGYVWAKKDAVISSADELASLEREIGTLSTDTTRLVLRLALSGRIRLPEISAVERWCGDLEAKVQHLSADLSGLLPAGADDDLSVFEDSDEVKSAAKFLQAIAADGEDERQSTAAAALVRLSVLTRQSAARGA
ncbi:MAG: DNA repair exonuclease [Alphaproteobacteria bacterium]|nr:DNA repair exonuclease [Alphaproteobacteria bacterium]